VRVVIRTLPLVATFVASMSMGLYAADIWNLTRSERVAAVITLAVVGLGESLRTVIGGFVRERQLSQARWISETLRALLVQVVKASQLDWTDVGVNAFLVRRQYRWIGRKVLKRVGRERIKSVPPPSSVVWTRGKGVIGACWEHGIDVGIDLNEYFASVEESTAEEWSALSDEERLRMTYEEFQRTRHYGVVVATPVLDRAGRVIGVVSADSLDGPPDRLGNSEVREALGAAAVAIRNLLESGASGTSTGYAQP
jgi:hypothetical protein